jgi:hypothetical protein
MYSRRGATPLKDTMVQDGNLWRTYKRSRENNQGRKYGERQRDKEIPVIPRKMNRRISLKDPPILDIFWICS